MRYPVAERVAAKAAGERFYETGKPCKNGHLAKRYTGTGTCSACAIAITERYQAAHPDRLVEYKSRETTKQLKRDAAKRHAKRYPEKVIERVKRWQAANPEKVKRYQRTTAQNNPEAARIRRKRYEAADPERTKIQRAGIMARRFARKKGNGGDVTTEQIAAIFEQQKGRCAECQKRRKLELDHIVALSKGGTSDASNIQGLCRSCNASKSARDPIEWAQSKGRLL